MTYIEKFKSSGLFDLGNDITEIAIDSILNEGLLKEIPIIKTISTFYKTGKSIKLVNAEKKIKNLILPLLQ